MKKITALFLSFLMVAMLLPINVWALELEAAGQEDNVSEEVVLEEIIPEDDFTDSAESEQEPLYADTVIASGYCGGEGDGTNLKWTLDGDGVLTISGKGAMADYGRKNMYEGNKAPWGQYIDRLNMLVLENGITNIGVSAFYKCDFMGDLIIPNSVTEIKGAAFEEASFSGKLVLSENLTVINSNAFYWCDFTSNFFIIPESVKTIKSFAFAFEYPAGFIFKGDAPSIRYEWDSDASLPSGSVVWFYKDNDTWELLYDGTWCAYSCVKMIDFGYCGGEDDGSNLIWILLENGELWIRGSGAMEDYNDYDNPAPWIKHKDELKSLSIGEGVTSIGDFAFYECLGFTGDLVIPDSVTTIGGGAFACCSGFDGELVIGKNTEKINEMAFTHCSSLEEKIIVPASVKTIAPEAFTKCGGKNFYFEGDAPNITVNQFDPDAIIYYIADNETWVVENGKWNGYTAVTYSTILSGYCGSEGDGTNLEWVIDINGVLTITGTGKMADYSAVYKGGKYVTTAPWGEYLEKIKMLVIEEGVTSIGEEAFRGCSVFTGDLIIPNSVENIKKRAFYECTGFTGKLVIGTGVTNIGEYAFSNCRGFAGNLVIGNSVKNIEYAAFSGCNKFTGDLVIPDSVISIGNSAFYECYGFKGSLVLGNNVASIGTYAFYRCSFAGDLVMPESITSIGNYAFRNCKINEYYFEGNAPTVKNYSFDVSDDTIYYPKNNATWVIENGKWNGYTAVPCVPAIAGGYCGGEGDGTNLEWVLDAEGVLTISGEGAMKDYGYYVAGVTYNAPWMDHSDEIKTLVIEEGVTTIGKNAFGDCSKITGNLVLPQSIKSIGNYAFMGCTGLTGNLIIPDGVTTIGDWAFYECGGFTGDLIIPDSVTKIGEWAFRYCSGFDGKLVISKNITVLESDVFNGCKGFVGDIVIPEGVTTIEGWAFSGCFGFDGKLVIPDTVTTIGMWAFSSCRNIDGDIIIPDSVVSIGNSAFQNCYGLSGKVVLGKNLESLGQQVFLYCGMDEFYFTGDAPSAIADGMNYQTFETAKDTIYYPKNNATWVIENGKWNGYTAMTWDPCLGADDYEHDFGEWYVFEEANCTEKGEERSDCDNCDRYETREIAAKGHDYKSVVTEPTCTEQGYTTYTCSSCGDSYVDSYVEAAGHSFGEWYETKAPTATKNGEERRDCENCDCCETREVEALGGEGAVYGDVNGDGKVNVFDANYIRRFAARILELSEKQLAVSDVNGDGKVNIMDANLIRRFAAKLIDKFPVEG